MSSQRLKVYLAGPMTNCNPKQKTLWRTKLKAVLRQEGFQILDPTNEGSRQGALAVSADISESDIVVANMWRESIGTVLGIVQAQRLGIPVVLIDKNYMESPVLNSLVDEIVHSEKDVLNKLQTLAKTFHEDAFVQKKTRSGAIKEEPFNFSKLQRAVESILHTFRY